MLKIYNQCDENQTGPHQPLTHEKIVNDLYYYYYIPIFP